MATINISDLRPTGSDLFSDSESYMNELNGDEFDVVIGGGTPTISISIFVRFTANKSSAKCVEGTLKISQAGVASVKSLIELSNPFNSF